jgi:hypothetical protein
MLNTTIASAVMASITHAVRPRKSQRPCKVVGVARLLNSSHWILDLASKPEAPST